MNSASSPPVLFLGDDDNDDSNGGGNDRYASRAPSSSTTLNHMQLPRKKRKLTDVNVQMEPSIVTWPKRQRPDRYHLHSEVDLEPILLDPEEYIIEEPDTQSFCSFDWTIQTRPPAPPPPLVAPRPVSFLPTRIPHSDRQTSAVTPSSVSYSSKRPFHKTAHPQATNTHDKFIPQPRNPTAVTPPRRSSTTMALPMPKPTASLFKPNVRRGRPTKASRMLYTQSTSPPASLHRRSDPQLFPAAQPTPRAPPASAPSSSRTSTTTAASSTAIPASTHSMSEIRRQILNGTGLFSAYHDTKYYQCNICKFKSVTSATLLQHLFTHMFFCEQCSFFTYSHYNLSQHIFDKHPAPAAELSDDPFNPKSFDLLYVTRCADGTFALCMDSSSNCTPTKEPSTDQRLVISSATPSDQLPAKPSKTKPIKPKATTQPDDNDVVLLSADLHPPHQRSSLSTRPKEKSNSNYVSMKHRRHYSLKKPFSVHALLIEYDICRENMIRLLCNTQDTHPRRRSLREFRKTRLIDEVADCLRTVVNDIVDSEENSVRSTLICTLPTRILGVFLSADNLGALMDSLKLSNKHEKYLAQRALDDRERAVRDSRKHVFTLSSPETNHSEQSIVVSLHSSMTNGDSIFTQTRIPQASSAAQQRAKKSSTERLDAPSQASNAMPPLTSLIPNTIPLRPVVPKPSRPLPNPSLPTILDRNNNSIPSTSSKVSNVIVID